MHLRAFAGCAEVGRDLRDGRAERTPREHAHEHADVLDPGHQLFDAHRHDVQPGKMYAQVGVAFVGAHHDRAGLRHREVGARHPRLGPEEERPRVVALAFGQVVDVAVGRVGADGAAEDFGDVATQLVHGRHDDMARWFVIELLDALSEVGLDHRDAALLEERAHVALVGQHGLRLHQRSRAMGTQHV